MFRLPSLFIAALLAITGFDIASGLEHWPFGNYPMYSLTYPARFTRLTLYGVNTSGEFSLRGDRNFPPFDDDRLGDALARVKPPDLPAALLNLLRLHNHNSPSPIRTLRLYSTSWTLHPGLQGNEPPEKKELLIEVSVLDR